MSRFARRSLGVLGAALALGLAGDRAALEAAQSPVMFLSVVDRSGMPVTDVKASQVTFMLSGRPCASVNLEPIDWPMKLQVLVDNGVAMAGSTPPLKEGLRAFLDALPEGVETSLLTYSPRPQFVVPPTTDPQKLLQSLDRLAFTASGAQLIEATSQAATRIARTRGAFFHTVMVVTTNGPEETRGNTREKVSRTLQELYDRSVTAHVLMFAPGDQVDGKLAGAVQAQTGALLARATHGTYESVSTATRLPAVMKEFGRKIARSNLLQTHQYRVSCDRSPSKAPRMTLSYSGSPDTEIFVTPDGRHIP